MTRQLLFVSMCSPLLGIAQDYLPLRSGMTRAFGDASGPGRMYSLALDSVVVTGTDTLLFNYFGLNDSISLFPGCGYLGGSECNQLNVPSWAGREILSMANGGVRFRTVLGDTLNLLPPTATMDTSWFYSDADQRFGLRLLTTDTGTFVGVLDSARFYQVIHVNGLGQVINSPLNDAPMTVGRSLGLVEFFQVDSFPLVLRRLRMIGDADRQIGLNCIADATIHDYQVADEIQYRHFEYSVFPETTYGYTQKETILSRFDTDTNVVYSIQKERFYYGSESLYTSMEERSYSKTDTIATIPFEAFQGMTRTMSQVDYCGSLLWHYAYDPDNVWSPCPWGPCWSPWVNGKGPNPVSSAYHIIGVGSGHDFSQHFIGWGGLQYLSHHTSIPYFKKNGNPCGTEVFVGIPEPLSFPAISLSPNPAEGIVTITAGKAMMQMTVYDPSGRIVFVERLAGLSGAIDLGELRGGVYQVEVFFLDGAKATAGVFVE